MKLLSNLLPNSLFITLVIALIGGSATVQDEDKRPNILVLITDDQDVLIGGTEYMPQLKRCLMDRGMTFVNAFVHTPVCCPSRSSMLTGRYIHNGGAINNTRRGNCYGQQWRETSEQDTFAVWLSKAGYQTGYSGKYLNTYGRISSGIPVGWDRWLGLVGNSAYYNYKMIKSDDRGRTLKVIRHGRDFEVDYLPNVIRDRTLEMIHEFAGNPFLIVAAWPSAHSPYTPAPEYQGIFENLQAYKTPNYNATTVNKHWMMRRLAAIDSNTAKWIERVYQRRLETLLTIDDHISEFIEALEKLNVLDNTYIIYMSDNGFQLGQHRLRGDKRQLYEHDIRVPFIVRGPGVPENTQNALPVLNIDVAPTLCDIATGSPHCSNFVDGTSFLPLLSSDPSARSDWREDFLISYHGEGSEACGMTTCPARPPDQYHGGDTFNNTYHCVRGMSTQSDVADDGVASSSDYIYCRFEDDEEFREYYDLTTDPWQLRNAIGDLTPLDIVTLERRLAALRNCQGATCRRKFRSRRKSWFLSFLHGSSGGKLLTAP